MSRKFIFGVAGVLILATTFLQWPKPTIYHHRYQGHRLSCLFGGVPADGNYRVTHGSDGTRDGEFSFWRNGKVVATCNIADDFESNGVSLRFSDEGENVFDKNPKASIRPHGFEREENCTSSPINAESPIDLSDIGGKLIGPHVAPEQPKDDID